MKVNIYMEVLSTFDIESIYRLGKALVLTDVTPPAIYVNLLNTRMLLVVISVYVIVMEDLIFTHNS